MKKIPPPTAFLRLCFFACLAACLAGAALTGCGVKPSDVSPPPDARQNAFPRTYPDPSTDMTP